MAKLDYQLNPVLMEGTVTKAAADDVALNLRGRLGVIHAAPSLFLHQPREGRKFRFYFSYMQIVEAPLDYDYAPLEKDRGFTPVLAGGVLSEVNDTAIKGRLPRRPGHHRRTAALGLYRCRPERGRIY